MVVDAGGAVHTEPCGAWELHETFGIFASVSVSLFTVIPRDPLFVPAADARKRAVTIFEAAFPRAEEIRCEVHGRATFIDAGENFEHVRCPRCGSDLLEPWQQAMDEAFENDGFGLRQAPGESGYRSRRWETTSGNTRAGLVGLRGLGRT